MIRWAGVVLFLGLTACAVPRSPCRGSERRAVQDSLYFGTQRPGGFVSQEEWAQFLETVITPRFPKGLTVAEAQGQWLPPNGSMVQEETHVLQLIHPDDAADDALVTRTIAEYRTRFDQDSVLRVKVAACVTF